MVLRLQTKSELIPIRYGIIQTSRRLENEVDLPIIQWWVDGCLGKVEPGVDCGVKTRHSKELKRCCSRQTE